MTKICPLLMFDRWDLNLGAEGRRGRSRLSDGLGLWERGEDIVAGPGDEMAFKSKLFLRSKLERDHSADEGANDDFHAGEDSKWAPSPVEDAEVDGRPVEPVDGRVLCASECELGDEQADPPEWPKSSCPFGL